MPSCFYYWIWTGKMEMCFSYLIFQYLFLDLHYTEWCFFFLYFNLRKKLLEVFCRKRCIQKFRKFDRETPVWESLFNKVAGLDMQISWEICEICKNTYFEEHLWTTASESVGNTTLLHEAISKKYTNGKINFQDGKEYNQKQHFDW